MVATHSKIIQVLQYDQGLLYTIAVSGTVAFPFDMPYMKGFFVIVKHDFL